MRERRSDVHTILADPMIRARQLATPMVGQPQTQMGKQAAAVLPSPSPAARRPCAVLAAGVRWQRW